LVAQRTVICERIRARLDDVGWTALDLAAAVRASEKTVYRWTTGEYAPRSEYLVSIARALDVSPMYLLGLSDEATPLHELLPVEAAR
jgi:transcriptional regulator with XRE-family HTH domain